VAALAVPVRTSAVSLGLSGLLVATLLPLHPNILDRPVGQVVRDTAVWEPLHLLGMLVFVGSLVGAAGVVAVHGGALGRLGRLGLVVTLAGSYAGVALFAVEGTVFPALARQAPALLDFDGPLAASAPLIGLGIVTGGSPLGLALLGIAAARAAIFPRTAGVLLAVSAVAYPAFAGPFVPIADVLAEVFFGVVQIFWAVLVWRAASAPSAAAADPEPSGT
jgi:hypothetical protein